MDYLDKIFPSNSFETAGYVLGKVNGDHWCMYVCSPGGFDSVGRPLMPLLKGVEAKPPVCHEDNVTLEILMTGLDAENMKQFWRTPDEMAQSLLPENRGLEKHSFKGKQHRIFVRLLRFMWLTYRLTLESPKFTPALWWTTMSLIRVATR